MEDLVSRYVLECFGDLLLAEYPYLERKTLTYSLDRHLIQWEDKTYDLTNRANEYHHRVPYPQLIETLNQRALKYYEQAPLLTPSEIPSICPLLLNKPYLGDEFRGQIFADCLELLGDEEEQLNYLEVIVFSCAPLMLTVMYHRLPSLFRALVTRSYFRGKYSLLAQLGDVFPPPYLPAYLWQLNRQHQRYSARDDLFHRMLSSSQMSEEKRKTIQAAATLQFQAQQEKPEKPEKQGSSLEELLTKSEDLEALFLEASREGKEEVFARLVEILDPQVGLNEACLYGHLSLIQLALRAGAIIQDTSINNAIYGGHLNLMPELLVGQAPDPFLIYAVMYEQSEIISYLMDHYLDRLKTETLAHARQIALHTDQPEVQDRIEICLSCSFEFDSSLEFLDSE